MIKLFEVAFEAMWRATQALATAEGLAVASPREAVRIALQLGLIDEQTADGLVQALRDRNLGVHAYEPALVVDILGRLAGHRDLLNAWLDGLSKGRALS